jgi:hypothetical protein
MYGKEYGPPFHNHEKDLNMLMDEMASRVEQFRMEHPAECLSGTDND